MEKGTESEPVTQKPWQVLRQALGLHQLCNADARVHDMVRNIFIFPDCYIPLTSTGAYMLLVLPNTFPHSNYSFARISSFNDERSTSTVEVLGTLNAPHIEFCLAWPRKSFVATTKQAPTLIARPRNRVIFSPRTPIDKMESISISVHRRKSPSVLQSKRLKDILGQHDRRRNQITEG